MIAARVAALAYGADVTRTISRQDGAADPDELLSHFVHGQLVPEDAALHRVIEHQLDGFVLHVRRRMPGLAAGFANFALFAVVIRRFAADPAHRRHAAALFFCGHVSSLIVPRLTASSYN